MVAREWTKDEVRRYVRDRVRISAAHAKHHADMLGVQFSFEKLVSEGTLPAEYAAPADPERLVRMFIRPDSLQIVVAGDAERNQSRAFMTNPQPGTARQPSGGVSHRRERAHEP